MKYGNVVALTAGVVVCLLAGACMVRSLSPETASRSLACGVEASDDDGQEWGGVVQKRYGSPQGGPIIKGEDNGLVYYGVDAGGVLFRAFKDCLSETGFDDEIDYFENNHGDGNDHRMEFDSGSGEFLGIGPAN